VKQRKRPTTYKLIATGLMTTLVLAGTAACTSSGSGQAGGSAASSASGASGSAAGKHVVFVTCVDSNPWCGVYNHTVTDTLEKAGVKVTVLNDNFDPTLQVQHMNQAIAAKPDAILFLAASDAALVPSIKKAKQEGIPVFATDGRADDRAVADLAGQLLADHPVLGTYAAQNLVEGLQKEGVMSGNIIAITGTASQNLVQDRMKAFKAELAKTPQYKLVAEEDSKWDQATAVTLAQQLFTRFRDSGGVVGAYGMADQVATGIIQAAQQAGIPLGVANKGLIVTSSNCLKVGAPYIKAGTMYGTATQTPVPEGKFVGTNVVKFVSGETLAKVLMVPEFRITGANYDQYSGECQAA